MSAVDTNFYEKKRARSFYVSLVLFFIVLATTLGLYLYTKNVEKNNIEVRSQISTLTSSIEEIEKDKNIQVYSIYSRHKELLDRLWEWSKIPSMIVHLKKIFDIHEIKYKWFAYSDGVVQTDLSLETNDSWYAFKKLWKFLTNYRALDENALFDIEQIPNFTWYDRMNFSAQFKLK